MKLQPLASEHIGAIIALEKASFSDPWPESLFVSEFAQQSRLYIGIFDDAENLLAYAGLLTCLDEGEILTIAVMPSARRQGLGARLMHELISEAKKLSLTQIFLEVRKSNASAIAMYERFGFVQYAERKRYYDNPPEDALLYKLKL